MAEDDIYGSKARYEHFKANLKQRVLPGRRRTQGARKYYCRNPRNLAYFRALFSHVEARDLSYIRRVRLLQTMRLICHLTSKDLADCWRDDINRMVVGMHGTHRTPKSKETFIKETKYIWKALFPETDEKGRPDDTVVPYAVRHLSARMDKSREKLRRDRLTPEEFERIVNYFSSEPRIQAYLTLALESLARPQELLYVRIRAWNSSTTTPRCSSAAAFKKSDKP